ncbi:uncharacterized protein LY89DRAFT_629279, partial [Mollisia scopiformis]
MNVKLFGDLATEAPKAGDTAFVFTVIKALQKANAFLGMVLYERTAQRFQTPTYRVINNVNCAIIPFNREMYTPLVEDAFRKALKHLAELAGSNTVPVAIVYHQDERLLELQPKSIPFAITHHAPLVDDVSRFFPGPKDILDAFGTDTKDPRKVTELRAMQTGGLRALQRGENGFVLAMSDLQGEHFKRSGVRPENIIDFPPPLQAMLTAHAPQANDEQLPNVDRKWFVFTAVARLTFFKNAELLVDAAVILLEKDKKLDLSVMIAGGDSSKPHVAIRDSLLTRVPPHLFDHFHIIERIPQRELYQYFDNSHVQETGIFVCCSRYETLGFTPLEAALSGVTTVITNTKQIEAMRYFPEEVRFEANAKALADLLEALFEEDDLAAV